MRKHHLGHLCSQIKKEMEDKPCIHAVIKNLAEDKVITNYFYNVEEKVHLKDMLQEQVFDLLDLGFDDPSIILDATKNHMFENIIKKDF